MTELNNIAKTNRVSISWIPSLSSSEGNYTADLLAKGSILNNDLAIENVLKSDSVKENIFTNWEKRTVSDTGKKPKVI